MAYVGIASGELLREKYEQLFSSGRTLSQLKDAVLSDRLFPKASGVAGRSLAWKLFLSKHEPLQASHPPRASMLLEQLKESRVKYTRLLVEKTKGPDDTDSGSSTTPERLSGTVRNLSLNNPLSLDNENPWHEWFAALELKTTISQDVERTFPEIPFFREAEVQGELTNILLVYSLTHPAIGYRQGMHELLAPLYYAVHFDSVEDQAGLESDLKQLCSRKWIAADSWALFDAVMNGVSRWYEWQDPSPAIPGRSDGQNGIQPYVAPIVKACTTIQNDFLKKCDPALWKAMQNAAIEPQIYGIRWLRLLFTREFQMEDAMKLWDGLFACDPTLDLALWVCVAMLIRIRNELIPADYSAQLTTLLRYPSPQDGASISHTSLLLRQALYLQMSPTPASSAAIVMENRTVLDIPIEVPEAPIPLAQRNRPPNTRQQSQTGFAGRPSSNGGASQIGHVRQSSSPAIGIPEMLTRGLLERGESLGINKTLISAVTELKRNIPDIAATLMRSPNQNEMSFPLEGEAVAPERPPWEPRSRLEVEREVSDIKKRDRQLGDSLGWIVDTLLQDESSVDDLERLQRKRREAVECLSYIRDVLISDAMDLDHERLIGEEETLRRRQAKRRAEESKLIPSTTVTQPLPVSTIDSRARKATERAFARSPPRAAAVGSTASGRREGLQQPPWNYTRSSFSTPVSAAASVPVASLPQRPQPTSTGRVKTSEQLSRPTSTPGAKLDDPLGALG